MSKEDSSLSCGAVGHLTARGVTIARPSAHQVGRNLRCVLDAALASDTIPPLDTMGRRRPFTSLTLTSVSSGRSPATTENLKCFRGSLYNVAEGGGYNPLFPTEMVKNPAGA